MIVLEVLGRTPTKRRSPKNQRIVTGFCHPLGGIQKNKRSDPGVARYAHTPGYYLQPLRGWKRSTVHCFTP
jgi:hypothetical protein